MKDKRVPYQLHNTYLNLSEMKKTISIILQTIHCLGIFEKKKKGQKRQSFYLTLYQPQESMEINKMLGFEIPRVCKMWVVLFKNRQT